MKLDQATDRYVEDMKADGRMGSANTEESYRYVLRRLAEDTGNAEVGDITRAQVKRTLAHWPDHITTQAVEVCRALRAALAAADREKPEACRAPHCFSEYGTPCGTCPAATPDPPDDEGWSPGIDDPEPLALGDIDTGEGWYQT